MKKNVFKLFASFIFMLFFINSIYSQNNPPTFTSTAVTSVNSNATYSYTITTNDADGDPVTVTAPTLPSWLSLGSVATVTTLAGSGTQGFADGTGTVAQFNNPVAVAVDGSGTFYVADQINHRIRKITLAGVVTTLAGSGTQGFADGTGTAARFNNPYGVAVDASGTVYVADINNHRIRKIISSGVVTTLAGSTNGFADGTGTAAQFASPYGVAVDGSGTVYVADKTNHRIRKITSSGVVTTLAGSGAAGFANGTGTTAKFYYPSGVAVGGSGTIYVADTNNQRIRKITQSKVLTGNATGQVGTHNVVLNANDGKGGSTDQSFTITVNDITAPTISSLSPGDNTTGVLISSNLVLIFSENVQKGTGNILIKDAADNSTVQAIDVTTSAVSISSTVVSINPTADLLKSKNYYIQISNTAFTDTASNAYAGIADMTTWNFATELNTAPTFTSTAVTSVNDNATYSYTIVTNDVDNDIVTLTAPTLPSWLSLAANVTVNTLAGSGTSGSADGTGTTAQFLNPRGVAVDASGTVYVADILNHRIRKITSSGVVTTLAGSTSGFTDGTGTSAQFNGPTGVAVDASGVVYVADSGNHRIRKITSSGVVTTLAGSGTSGFADGTGISAQFANPGGLAIDTSGTVYIADTFNHRIRKITSSGVVTTLAGSTSGFTDGTGTVAQFNKPFGVAVDGSGIVYVADNNNNRIRKITGSGVVTTLAGSGTLGFADGTGTASQFNQPYGVAVDASGTVYVADSNNNRIRRITSSGVVTTLAGSGTGGFADGTGTSVQFNLPTGVVVDGSGTVYVSDYYNTRIRKITQIGLTGEATGQASTHNVVLNANDGNGGSTNQSFTITVNDITAPTVTTLSPADNATGVVITSNLVLSFSENVQKGTGNILIKDAADNSTVQTIDVTTSAVSISSTVVSINLTADLLKSKNYYIQIPNTAFTDTASNAYAGIADTTTWNFATELNNAPTVIGSGIPSQTLNEDFGHFYLDLKPYFSDVETANTGLLYTLQTTTYAIFQTISIGNGILRITSKNNAFGSEIVTIIVYDPEGLFAADNFSITVFPVNDPPTLYPLSDSTIDEDAAEQTINLAGISAGPDPVQTLTITATSDNTVLIPHPTVTYTNGNTTGSLTYTPVTNANGTAIITVTVSDDGGGTTNQTVRTFVITVNAVNDPPTTSNVTFTGTLEIGQILTGTYTYADTENDTESGSTYKWYRSDDNAGTNKAFISGATATTYTLVTVDVGKYLSFEVTPKDGAAFGTAVESALQGSVIKKTPTITFTDISKVYGAADFNLAATSNSTGTISYSIVTGGTGSTTLSGTNNQTVSLGSVGTVTIRASLTADADYNAAIKDITLTITAAAVTATTQAASSITTAGGVLNGTLYDGGATTTASFEYGTASDLTGATTSSATPASITSGSGTTSASLTLTGLVDNTIYYYRIKGTNSVGIVNGSIMSFTTLDDTPPSIVTTVPVDDAIGVTSSNLSIVFNEDVQKGTGDILIKRTSDNQTVATIAVNGSEVTINNTSPKGTATAGTINIHISPSITLPSNTAMHIEIPSTAFTDMAGNAFPGFSLNTTWNFSTDVVLSIENNVIKGFAMYPNPASDNLNLSAQEQINQIQIFNLMGQKVLQKSVNSNKAIIKLSRLPQGTYFIKITTDKTSKAVKLIKW